MLCCLYAMFDPRVLVTWWRCWRVQCRVQTVSSHLRKSCSVYACGCSFHCIILGLSALRSSQDPCLLYRSLCTLSPLSRVCRVLITLVPSATRYQSMWLCPLILASMPFILSLCSTHCSFPSRKWVACLHCHLSILSAVFIPVRSKRCFSPPDLPGWLWGTCCLVSWGKTFVPWHCPPTCL